LQGDSISLYGGSATEVMDGILTIYGGSGRTVTADEMVVNSDFT
jgi:hypothetical protein